MQVSALADALAGVRTSDSAISMRKLQGWLSGAGLDELARAVSLLATSLNRAPRQEPPGDDEKPWF